MERGESSISTGGGRGVPFMVVGWGGGLGAEPLVRDQSETTRTNVTFAFFVWATPLAQISVSVNLRS